MDTSRVNFLNVFIVIVQNVCSFATKMKLFLVKGYSLNFVKKECAKFRGSQIFSRGYFVGPKLFLVGIS